MPLATRNTRLLSLPSPEWTPTMRSYRATVAAAIIATALSATSLSSAAAAAPNYEVVFSTVIGGHPGGIAVDAVTHRAYVLSSNDGAVVVMSPKSGKVLKRVHISTYTSAIAIDSNRRRAYIASSQDSTVTVLSTKTNKIVKVIPVPSDPTAIAIDSALNRVFVNNLGGTAISVISQKTNRVVKTIDAGITVVSLRANTRTHQLYGSVFNSFSPGQIAVFNGKTGAYVDTMTVGDFPGDIALDQGHHRGYASTYSDGIAVFDTTNNEPLAGINVDSTVSGVAIDVHAGVLYATVTTNYNGQPGDAVSIISLKTGQILDTVDVAADGTGSGVSFIAADSRTHRVWESGSGATEGVVTLIGRE